ncbi:methyltransferase (TIGR00027 family) [Nocardia transvalensis]|uniref:S-adenosyl-L-methionine-dependent methyltransferase n=1 Tax=Nocardia transvalensis TaxID=37333 RepID=A0A7W9PKJ8_9NOCA|nr:class I SAM-dependent methyltransferase [Nocardia transvalensis]MBB5917712.1 methyltransferase (TIGR00027 family) [Nocardia transvalensis]
MRTDDDSWDITESVGITAVGVAAMRAVESRRPDALFRDPYAERLVDAVGSGWTEIMRGEVRSESGRLYGPMGAVLIARTVYFDEYFHAAAADGIRQVVILASGLDARAYRLEWPSDTVVFELDQPKVLEFKARALGGERLSIERHEVAVDLRQDWPKALRDNGFDPAAPTAWLAEGLLRYLPADAQDRLFAEVVALSAPGSRMALNIGRDQRADSAEIRELQARRSEALAAAGITVDVRDLWYSWEGRSDPRDWFADHGWTVTAAEPADVLTGHGREATDVSRPEMNRHILMTATLGDDN